MSDPTDEWYKHLMSDKNPSGPSLKQKAMRELREFVVLSIYLAFFFCGLVTYRMLLLHQFHVVSWPYAFALINAAVVAKVIMIGEYAKVGTRYEDRPLLLSVIWKAFLFSLLVFAFHFVEELIKLLVHGEPVVGALRDIQINDLLARCLVIFSTFITLFGFREFRRVLGEEKFNSILFRSESADK